jgi:hypothetical protein
MAEPTKLSVWRRAIRDDDRRLADRFSGSSARREPESTGRGCRLRSLVAEFPRLRGRGSDTEESYSPARYFNSSAPLPSPSSAGLVFRLNDEGYYALLVRTQRKGGESSFEILKRQYGASAPIEVVRWTRFRVPQTHAPAMKISVECRGSQITVFVNDQEVGRAQDPSYAQGYAGLIVSGDTRAIFRELVVEEIP